MIKSIGAKIYAAWSHRRNRRWINNPEETQEKVLKNLIKQGLKTRFGKDHSFEKIKDLNHFRSLIPIRDYEDFRPYIESVLEGENDILWPGRPIYYAKSSGTTSGVKFIPITKASMPQHIRAAREALLNYIYQTGKTDIVNGKHIFIQGSPVLENNKGVAVGRLSGIVAHYVPSYLIGGIPSWVQMYFEMLTSKAGKTVDELFPNFSLFVYGGVNFEPYRGVFKKLIGRTTDSLEFYPASEGFFAYQDIQEESGLLLLLDHGIYYEFILASTFFDKNPQVFTLDEVELDKNYVMIISSTAGLWRYNIGDTIQFKSIYPFRIVVSGRIKHFISAFGEHVIVSEVERALKQAIDSDLINVTVREFTVAPQVEPEKGLPYHEWFIEFDNPPINLEVFASRIDEAMQTQNIYYNDLITGKILRPLLIKKVAPEGFKKYMKSEGKLGGQNKVPRVSDNRKIADVLNDYLIQG